MSEFDVIDSKDNLAKSLKDDVKRKLVNETRELWHDWTEQLRPLLDESIEGWQLYAEGVPRAAITSGGMKDSRTVKEGKRKGVRMGIIARSVDSIHSIQHNSTFPVDERFFDGRPENDVAKEYQDMYESWKTDNLAEIDFQGAMNSHRKNAIIDGTACCHVPWRTKKETTVEYVPFLPIPGVKVYPDWFLVRKEKKDYVCWEGTDAEPLNFTDWRADPCATKFDEGCGFMRRYYLPTWQVEEEFGLKDVQAYHDVMDLYDGDRLRKETFGIQHWSIGKTEAEGKKQALLTIRYDNFVAGGKVYKNHLLIMLNDTELVFFDENPYDHKRKPYLLTPYNKLPNSVYGKSGIRDVLSVANTCDVSVTQLIDIMSWAASPVFEKDISDPLVAAMGDIEIKPGLQIPVKMRGAISQIPINIANAEALLILLDRLEGVIREQTGATPVFSGADPSQGKGNITAFQVGAHVEGGNNRFSERMTVFNNTTLAPFMQMAWENDRQFMTQSHMVPGFSEPLTPAIVKQMKMGWTITATQASMNRQREIANLKEILTSFPQLEQLGLVTRKQGEVGELDVLGVLKRLYEKAGVEADAFLQIRSVEQPASLEGMPSQQVLDISTEGAAANGLPAGGTIDSAVPGASEGDVAGTGGPAGIPAA